MLAIRRTATARAAVFAPRRWLRLLAGLLLASSFACLAAPSADLESRKRRLADLRSRVEALQKELTASEARHEQAVDALRSSEQAISEANRQLVELRQSAQAVESELAQVERELAAGRERFETQLAMLGRLAIRQTVAAGSEPLRILLSGDDPHAAARRLHYLRLLNAARGERLSMLANDIAGLRALQDQQAARRDELAKLEQESRAQRAVLERERRERGAVLARIAAQAEHQRRQLSALQRDEGALARLVERLGRIVERVGRPAAPAASRVDPPSSPAGVSVFEAMRGRMQWPVVGELLYRFGTPRRGGGPAWKGIFIRCPPGAEVRSVAAGQVVFADWLRGFGNLLIVDHGEGFMSLYGNNDSLLRRVGAEVAAGEVVAHSGSSGGSEESGLYFEIRHQSRALDPLGWMK